MLGWDVMVVRKVSGNPPDGTVVLARWTTGLAGLRWFDEMVKINKATDLGGNGYPLKYSIAAGVPDSGTGMTRSASTGASKASVRPTSTRVL